MNDAHFHLIVNHVPIVGGFFVMLFLGYGILRKQRGIISFAMGLFVALGVASFVAHSTGEGAEEVLEHGVGNYNMAMVEEHEEAAFPAHLAMMVTAFASLITLIVRKLREGNAMPIVVFVLSIVAFGLMARAGNLGGKIAHPEIENAAGVGNMEHDDD